MASLPNTPLTEEQYLAIEENSATKNEFHDGCIFAMAGGSPNHSLIANNIGAILRAQVPPGCRTFNADLRIKVAAAGLYTYADCSVLCGEPQFAGDRRDSILNPLLIVEVLSPSTEGYDRGKKFELYRSMESFREYMIVHQDQHRVEHYSKQEDGGWLLRDYSAPDAAVVIPRLGVRIPLADLYSSTFEAA